MSAIAGTDTGCVVGQWRLTEYAMWLWWSGLSRFTPSQQFGNITWSRRPFMALSGHVGTVDEFGTPPFTPQFQNVTRMLCASVALELPAIIFSPGGNARTVSAVPRR